MEVNSKWLHQFVIPYIFKRYDDYINYTSICVAWTKAVFPVEEQAPSSKCNAFNKQCIFFWNVNRCQSLMIYNIDIVSSTVNIYIDRINTIFIFLDNNDCK